MARFNLGRRPFSRQRLIALGACLRCVLSRLPADCCQPPSARTTSPNGATTSFRSAKRAPASPNLTALFIAVRAAPALAFRLRVRVAAAQRLLEMGPAFLFGPAPLIFGDASLARRRPDRWFRFVLFCFARRPYRYKRSSSPAGVLRSGRRLPGGLALSAACVICYPRSRLNPVLLNNGLTFEWCVEVLTKQPRAARRLTWILGSPFKFPLPPEPNQTPSSSTKTHAALTPPTSSRPHGARVSAPCGGPEK